MNRMLAKLQEHILKELSKKTSQSSNITIGIEHEFFLVDLNNRPVDFDQSQAFFEALSRIQNWRIFSSKRILGAKNCILRVSKEQKGQYTALKYEHPPALLEVAFGYHSDLHSLRNEVFSVWCDLESAASKVRTKILSLPSIPRNSINPETADIVSESYRNLSLSRRRHFAIRGEAVDESVVDFPAHVASTQIHIGGLKWWENEKIVRAIYCLESLVQPFGYNLATKSQKEASDLSAERWRHYTGVFRGMTLLGFPKMIDWTFENWTQELFNSPLFGSLSDPTNGKKISELDLSLVDIDITALLARVRDLQIIRPKLFGTLEFRADAAQPGPKEIVSLAAMRLAQCLISEQLVEIVSPEDFSKSRELWWAQTNNLPAQSPDLLRILERMHALLEQRGLSEEDLLEKKVA